MSLILNGSSGVSDVDGSASTPAIRGTDTNTGMFFPAADTIAFAEGGTEVVRINSSGQLLVGTSSAGNGSSFYVRGSGTTSSTASFEAANSAGATRLFIQDDGTTRFFAASETMRIDSSGNLLVGTTDTNFAAGVGFKILSSSTVPQTGIVTNTASGLSNYHYYNTNATNNGYRFYVKIDGGVANFSGNNVNLSDERTKTNIELSGSYLDKICSIPVKLFNYKDEPENTQKTLGVIAQDVEAVAPELVDKDGWLGEAPEGEEPLKSIYTTDMMFALMKSIQELKAELDTVKTELATLKGAA